MYWSKYRVTSGGPFTNDEQVTEKDESIKRTHKDLWDKEGAPSEVGCSGLPIGVQVVTLPFHEEMCVSVLNQIGELIPFTSRAK